MNRLRRVINNAIISFLGQAVNWTSTLLLTIAYGHFLGAFKFGELYFAVNFIALIGFPVNSGFDRQTIRDVAQKPEKAAAYLSNMLLIRLGTWFIIYALVLLASWLLGYSPGVRMLLTSYASIDTVLLSLMTNSAVVGWYGAANRLFDTMSFLPAIVITTIMSPIFSKLSLVSDADLKLAAEKSVNFLLFCGIPIATAMIVAAPNIIRF